VKIIHDKYVELKNFAALTDAISNEMDTKKLLKRQRVQQIEGSMQ
jgi:hypothetical protein